MTDVRTFLMMGRPGAGKGTQAKLLAGKIGGEVYSSGSYLRPLSQENTHVGRKVKEVMDSGDLLPSWFSIYVFEKPLLQMELQDGIVFEGACRRTEEAIAFDETATWLERPYAAIFLDADEAVLKSRLLKRQGIEGRSDDVANVIDERFKKFREDTEPAIEFFREKGKLFQINGEQEVEKVHQDILSALQIK